VRKFYFRTIRRTQGAEIRFKLPGGDAVVPVTIWSFEDQRAFRKHKGKLLPRRWPLGEKLTELKQKQTMGFGQPKGNKKGSGGWLNVSDDRIWDMQPDSTIPRWHWVNIRKGCPIHGAEIYRKRSYYPWIKDTSLPYRWKIKCPVGGEEYPSNDFANGDFTSGDYPDDGIGGAFLHSKGKAPQHTQGGSRM